VVRSLPSRSLCPRRSVPASCRHAAEFGSP
jgi:hypothetical protein